MIARLAMIAGWLAAGGAVLGGLYWTFLNTTESDVFRLTLSAVLALMTVVLAGFIVNVALLLALGGSAVGPAAGRAELFRSSVSGSFRSLHAFVVAAFIVGAAAWATARGDDWVARHAGEISAWFIAKFDWEDVTSLFRVERYVSAWLRWVVVPAAALAGLAGFIRERRWRRAIGSMFAAWRWRPLLLMTAAFVVLIVLPARYAVGAEPERLPPTWVQPTVAILRLSLIGASIAVGTAIMLITTARAALGRSVTTPDRGR